MRTQGTDVWETKVSRAHLTIIKKAEGKMEGRFRDLQKAVCKHAALF